ncbi:phage regulatory protein, Rha family [Dethiosulfovibrio peptidovorans DSM 11002]|uniref:Phage regulatory protein, Rha family n=1 Tax=Dethiosulfovibrio peptidovorans DSM 11002 TaxID=469381 RepID=D2Z2C3_9BACT|nr:phage regulatory protein/antirepressor Ant [Dethiosulfovibrio peptidovorans]EFC90079.1 phage regulatory protein, Rha family [Dethiosulfovibrio peptidovorans DSM 11002]
MNNKLGIVVKDEKVVVSSRDVARVFEKPHNDVLKTIRALGCSETFALGNFSQSSYFNEQNREMPEYLMTRDGFTLLAMGYTGARAMAFKEQYIKAFNKMEAELKDRGMFGEFAEQIPKSMSEALILAGQLEEKRAALAAKVEQDAPKVRFAESVETSHTSILIGDLAKLLRQNGIDIGQNRLFSWLRESGFLMKNGSSRNMPTQRAMNMKLFEVKERTINNPDGTVRITRTTKVTGRGQVYFVNKFLGVDAVAQ